MRVAATAESARERFVYIEEDGTARELKPAEAEHLSTDYGFGDGAFPYIKDDYEARNGWGHLNGYLKRDDLPAHVDVRTQSPEGAAHMLKRTSGHYKVVVNHEEQYSVVPAVDAVPKGMKEVGKVGTADECLTYIEEVWTDMKPADRQRILGDIG